MVTTNDSEISAEKPKFFSRLHAWWEGYEIVSETGDGEPASIDFDGGVKPEDVEGWSPERIEAAQRIFGYGFLAPGGVANIDKLIAPLGMNEKMSIIECGARIGAVSRRIAESTGAWVTGFEQNPVLVAEAVRLAKTAGLAKKAAIDTVDMDESDIRDNSRDVALAIDSLFIVEDKAALLHSVARMLKSGGQFLLTDFVRAIPQDTSPDIEIWAAYETDPPHVVEIKWLTGQMEALGFDIRVVEDSSKSYCQLVMTALQRFSASIAAEPVAENFKPWIMSEVEIWAQRLAALQGADVAHYRIHAILK